MKEYTINGTKVNEDTEIEFVSNPKRPTFKSHARYEDYQVATTIGEYFEIADKKYAKADLRYDEEHGHLTITHDDEIINS
jgi:hypothetical protein